MHFKGDSAVFIDEDEPCQIKGESGEMEDLVGRPDEWARLQDIYVRSTVYVTATEQPMFNIVQGEVGDWCIVPCVVWKELRSCVVSQLRCGHRLGHVHKCPERSAMFLDQPLDAHCNPCHTRMHCSPSMFESQAATPSAIECSTTQKVGVLLRVST